MKVTVFGIGYVGLVQAAVLAEVGHDVVCVDVDQNKVDNLKKGIIPIFEPGLHELVKKNVKANRLSFETDIGNSLDGTLTIFEFPLINPNSKEYAKLVGIFDGVI